MKNAARLVVWFLALGILTIGCQNEPNMMGSPEPSSMGQPGMAKLVIPAGATLVSAKLYVYEIGAHGHTVNVHRITADSICHIAVSQIQPFDGLAHSL